MCGRDKGRHEHEHAHGAAIHSHDGAEHRHEATVHSHEHGHDEGHHTHAHIQVKGMTCEHCVAAVTQALQTLPGISGFRVDLASGLVSYQTAGPVSSEEVARAIAAAGYEVATA
jgi:copper chaperone CopZ